MVMSCKPGGILIINMSQFNSKNHITIVGAGISGLTLALLLSRQGHSIYLFDKRSALDQAVDGRSINFTISHRGLYVLEKLGLKEAVIAQSAVLVGRTLHLQNAKTIHYKYGTKKSQALLSICRGKLIQILLTAIADEPTIHFYPHFELTDIDDASQSCHFVDRLNEENHVVKADYIVGADGVFSSVRQCMLKKQITSYQQTVFSWGYKEYQLNAAEAATIGLSTDHMHMWPKEKTLLVAIPNLDATFSVIFTAPLKNELSEDHHFDELVKREYPHIVNATPSFLTNAGENASNYLISVRVDKWHYNDKIVLLGDACHATYPFYGQGMNSALEDALYFYQFVSDPTLTRLEAFAAYEKLRKADTNALHELSEAHLYQMTKAMISPYVQAGNLLDYQLAKWLPKRWIYEYELVAQSTISYSSIHAKVKRQNQKKAISGFFIISSLLGLIIWLKRTITFLPKQEAS